MENIIIKSSKSQDKTTRYAERVRVIVTAEDRATPRNYLIDHLHRQLYVTYGIMTIYKILSEDEEKRMEATMTKLKEEANNGGPLGLL